MFMSVCSDVALQRQITESEMSALQRPNNFYVQTSKRVYNLRAPSTTVKTMWMSLLSAFNKASTLFNRPIAVPFILKSVALCCIRHIREHGAYVGYCNFSFRPEIVRISRIGDRSQFG